MQEYAVEMLVMFFALAVVVALAWLVIRSMAWMYKNKHRNDQLSVRLTLQVGSRERLMVVRYQSTEYLLGVTSGGISLLDKQTIDLQQENTPVKQEN